MSIKVLRLYQVTNEPHFRFNVYNLAQTIPSLTSHTSSVSTAVNYYYRVRRESVPRCGINRSDRLLFASSPQLLTSFFSPLDVWSEESLRETPHVRQVSTKDSSQSVSTLPMKYDQSEVSHGVATTLPLWPIKIKLHRCRRRRRGEDSLCRDYLSFCGLNN